MATKYFVAVNVFKYFSKLVAYSLYCVCWSCAFALNFIINRWMFTSYDSRTDTAKLGWILWKYKFYAFREASPTDFLCMFRTRVRPEYVLRPTVSLYAITRNEAIVVETLEGINIYSSDVHPFFMAAQFLNATKVIRMSVRDFVSLAEKIGDPLVPVLWISNTGRCGGSVLSQMFESVPGALVIHEPDPPFNLYNLNGSNTIQTTEYKLLLKSVLRIMCKPRPGITRICIKPRPQCVAIMTNIGKLGLDIRQVFMYRNSLDTLRSWLALMTFDPFAVVIRVCTDAVWFSNILPYFRNILRYYFIPRMKRTSDLSVNATTTCMFAHMWANQILIARDEMSCDRSILPVKYEDILTEPTMVVKQLFERSGVDIRHVERAVATLSRDSQRGSVVSRAKIGDASHRYISETEMIKCDAIFTQCNLPLLGEDIRLQNKN